ncbi:MAG: radical SAM protein, partial [Bacteroidetes bacterium]|nr:radical SAM protein [Bacteroidota bacterium]
ENGYREVTLLGQNVDSYLWHPETNTKKEILKIEGERENGRQGEAEQNPHLIEDAVTFANLLEMVAKVNPLLRVRFSTSNPRDITEDVLYAMKKHDNICKYIHLPVQSGNTRILEKMNRGYSREDYLKWIDRIKSILPDCGISTDTITGFCSETEEEHQDTLSLMEKVGFVYAYMFSYSERPGTAASKQYPDDVPEEIKARRLTEVMMLQKKLSLQSNLADINKVHRVLVENVSKRSDKDLSGRNDQNKIVVFPREQYKKGDYVDVLVTECSSATLIGKSLPNPS